MKNRLLQAMKSLPMLAEDKEKFVNEISNINSNGGGGSIEYEYYKVPDLSKIGEFGEQYATFLQFLLMICDGCIVKVRVNELSHYVLCDIHSGQLISTDFESQTLETIKVLKILKSNNLKISPDIALNEYGKFVSNITPIYVIGEGNNVLEQLRDATIKMDESFKELFEMDVIYQLFKSITKEEYESMIGQIVE